MHLERVRRTMWIKQIIMAFIGLSAGGTVAAGVFAFITTLGLLPRMAARTNTASWVRRYEGIIILGESLGNLWSVYQFSIPVGTTGLITWGLLSGIYVGCLAMALAETLQVMPVFTKRAKLTTGLRKCEARSNPC